MNEYCKNCYELAEQLHRYKQVVKDIKEIASLCSYATPKDFYETRMKQIIQKCEEVNNEH